MSLSLPEIGKRRLTRWFNGFIAGFMVGDPQLSACSFLSPHGGDRVLMEGIKHQCRQSTSALAKEYGGNLPPASSPTDTRNFLSHFGLFWPETILSMRDADP